ncbi:hypothetical protein BDR26DRAFT_498422 [Obelidium mucronatum]|nr:hypothetical protein BDR26DRAFT_498422 [Obelidium mucronatum]
MVLLLETLLSSLILQTSSNKLEGSVLLHASIGEPDRSTAATNQTITSLTDALSRLQDINNPNSPRTSQGSLEHLDGYAPASIPTNLDLAAIKDYSRTVGCNHTYQTALLALEESLTHIDRIVLASFETVKLVTDAFVRIVEGFRSLGSLALAISSDDPDSFLDYVDSFFHVWELFRSSGDSRPNFTLEICDRTTPVKKWMQRKIEMGAAIEYFDYNLNWNGYDPTDTVGANVVVRFANKTTLRGIVALSMNKGYPLKLLFRFEIAECSPADFSWEHVYPDGYGGLTVDKK